MNPSTVFKKIGIAILIVSGLGGGSSGLFGAVQDSLAFRDSTSTYRGLPPVVVTATRVDQSAGRTPMATAVLHQNSQRADPEISLDETLRQVPGLVINNRYNYALGERLVIRGIGSRAQFGIRGIKILVDDIPLTLPDGQAQTGNIDLSTTGRVDVIRGPASSLYGNAAGGVIHFHTQQATNSAPWQVQARDVMGSFGMRKWVGKFQRHTGNSQYIIGGDQMTTSGFRDHSASRIRHINAVWRTRFSEQNRVTVVGNLYDAPYLLNPSTLSKADARHSPTMVRQYIIDQGAGEEGTQGQAGFTWQHNLSETQFFKTTLYGLRRTLLNPIPGRIIDLGRYAGGFRSFYQTRFRLHAHPVRFSAGVDVEYQHDRRKEYQNEGLSGQLAAQIQPSEMFRHLGYGALLIHQLETVRGIGPFMQVEAQLYPQVWLLAGGRYDQYRFGVEDHLDTGQTNHSGSRTMAHFSPMVGVSYSFSPGMNCYGNLSTAFQTPTTAELGNRPSGEGGFNPNLQPENIVNYELGMKGDLHHSELSYDVAGYILNINDMLIPYQLNPLSDEVFHRNAGAARNVGIETQLKWRLNQQISTQISYTYQNFTFRDFQTEYQMDSQLRYLQLAGNMVPGVPWQQFYWNFSYQPPTHLFGEMELHWTSKYFANNFNGPPPEASGQPTSDYVNDAHTVLNMRGGFRYPLGPVSATLFFGVNNLLDQRYNASIVPNAFGGRFFEPAPGRHWFIGLEVMFRGARSSEM